jgi:hypothetical protein
MLARAWRDERRTARRTLGARFRVRDSDGVDVAPGRSDALAGRVDEMTGA